jgi:hypothetical protein
MNACGNTRTEAAVLHMLNGIRELVAAPADIVYRLLFLLSPHSSQRLCKQKLHYTTKNRIRTGSSTTLQFQSTHTRPIASQTPQSTINTKIPWLLTSNYTPP